MVNLSAQIRHFALRTPDKVALIYEDQRITYADFTTASSSSAAG